MDLAYEISNLKEELEIYKGEELKFKLAQIATKKASDMSKPEQKIFVDDALFERCIMDENPSHAQTARNRGFLRARYIPYGYHTDGGIMYRHGIVNIINIQAKRNAVRTVEVGYLALSKKINELHSTGYRIIDIKEDGPRRTVSYTQQRYIFD